MRKIEIPNAVGQRTIRNFLTKCDLLIQNEEEIQLCFPKRFVFMEPFALAMLAAFGDLARGKGITISLETTDVTGLGYLKRMHLFHYLHAEYPGSIQELEEAGRFVPICRVVNDEDLKTFIASLMPLWHLEEDSALAVSYCVSELVRNVLEHAGLSGAYVCAQYYKKESRVAIGVADHGIGILHSLSQNYPDLKTYHNAVVHALKPGVTGSRSFENAGAGLFFIKSLAKLSNSWFSIYSGDTCYRLAKRGKFARQIMLFADPLEDKHDLWSDLTTWQGTVVAVDIHTQELQQFTRLLSQIKGVYEKEKAPRPQRKIRFT